MKSMNETGIAPRSSFSCTLDLSQKFVADLQILASQAHVIESKYFTIIFQNN
jgi:hypothetical protein